MGYRPRRSSRKNNTTLRLSAIIFTLVIAIAADGVGSFGGCAQLTQLLPGALTQRFSNAASVSTLGDIPAYSGSATVYINADTAHPQGTPAFTLEEISRAQSSSFTEFSRLDYLDRCGAALACLGPETLPTRPRENISHVYPSGWDQRSYDFIDEGVLYNRCHLIAFSLCGENDNECNLITGTRAMNVDGMEPLEEQTVRYIERTHNHVLYRVAPLFEEGELVARGVHMETYSLEDAGAGLSFNVFCYNNQPGVTIDYVTGASRAA